MYLETSRAKQQCLGKSPRMMHSMQHMSSPRGWLFQALLSALDFLRCSASISTVTGANASCAASASVLRTVWAEMRWIQVSIFAPNLVGESNLSGGQDIVHARAFPLPVVSCARAWLCGLNVFPYYGKTQAVKALHWACTRAKLQLVLAEEQTPLFPWLFLSI